MTAIKRDEHRVTVWARGANGVPVTCACGWKDRAFTMMGAYKKKREHLAQAAGELDDVA